ncbi:MAG: hypothetical protein IKM23_00135 [Bacteroidales bacterium]|nr:hypothetical protein [Bacteroidales bacterium]
MTKTADCCPSSVDKIKAAVERQLRDYPKSTLQDLYKSFFQDRFGPGHLVNDTSAAGNYLRYELNNSESFHERYYEPTGYESNYYRVNLSVIRENKISYQKFFDAFLRSVENVGLDKISEWKSEWSTIESVIISMNLDLENFDADLQMIHTVLEQGKYAVHHSEIYNSEYHPHYRIIDKNIFEEEILPLITNSL